jgi:hypothetical protein
METYFLQKPLLDGLRLAGLAPVGVHHVGHRRLVGGHVERGLQVAWDDAREDLAVADVLFRYYADRSNSQSIL